MNKSLIGIAVWIILFPVQGFCLDVQEKKTFGGGMAVQAGYASFNNMYGNINGGIFGLGGRMHFYLGKHFRVGGGGAAVKLSYEDPGLKESWVRIGYGGLTAEFTRPLKEWQISLGVLAGGAGFRNLHVLSTSGSNTVNAFLDYRTTLVLSPIFTLERSLSEAIALMGMVDYLWGPDLGDQQHLGGPKVHIGVLFAK